MMEIKRDPRLNRGTAQGQLPYWDTSLNKFTPIETSKLFWDNEYTEVYVGEDGSGDSTYFGAGYFGFENSNDDTVFDATLTGIESSEVLSFTQESSDFSGVGLYFSFGRTDGSFDGKFLSFENNSSEVFNINSTGGGYFSDEVTIKGAGDSSATSSLNITNLSGNSLLYVRNDGKIGIGRTDQSCLIDAKSKSGEDACLRIMTGSTNQDATIELMEFSNLGARIKYDGSDTNNMYFDINDGDGWSTRMLLNRDTGIFATLGSGGVTDYVFHTTQTGQVFIDKKRLIVGDEGTGSLGWIEAIDTDVEDGDTAENFFYYESADYKSFLNTKGLFVLEGTSFQPEFSVVGSGNIDPAARISLLENANGWDATNYGFSWMLDGANNELEFQSKNGSTVYVQAKYKRDNSLSSFLSTNNYFSGNVGIGTTSPTAVLHLKAGTATAGTAPLKFTAGTALTTPEAGVIEYHDDRFYITNVANRRAIDRTNSVINSTVTVSDTTTETTVFTAPLPANSIKAGNIQQLRAFGVMSTANASDTCIIRIKAGGTLVASVTSPGKNLSNAAWEIKASTTIRTVGASGVGATIVTMIADDQTSVYTSDSVALDTTGDLDLTVTVEWDSADEGNTISIYQGWLEWKN